MSITTEGRKVSVFTGYYQSYRAATHSWHLLGNLEYMIFSRETGTVPLSAVWRSKFFIASLLLQPDWT